MKYSGSNLLGYAVYAFIQFFNVIHAESGVTCKDQQGRSYENTFMYIPGPEPCTFCVCDNGNPKWCKALLCNAEEFCKPSRHICCQYICMDDTLLSVPNDKTDSIGSNTTDAITHYDIGLRSVASFVTAVLSLSLLFFLIHRLRQRKIRGRQNRQLAEDQRNLGSMGYLERDGLSHGVPMDDIPCGASYALWKPPNNYFPRGEAPPPYEEAVAAARAEQALLSMNPQTLPQLNFPNTYLPNTNSRTSISFVGSTQSGINGNSSTLICDSGITDQTGLISTPSRPISNPNIYASYRQSNQNETLSPGVSVGTSTTSFTMGTSTYENLPTPIGIPNFVNQRPDVIAQPLSNLQSAIPKGYQTHTTLPRQTGAFTISATLPNSNVTAHRTIPRTLTTRTGAKLQDIINDCTQKEFLRPTIMADLTTPNLPHSTQQNAVTKMENTNPNTFYEDMQIQPPSASSSGLQQIERQPLDHKMETSHDFKPPLNIANGINEEGSFESVACTCSMQALSTLHDDTDDYRSECENCKSATGSRYYLDNEDELITSPHETMTLHRRPDETASNATPQYYRTSLTLPISTRQRTRSTGVRENWFNPMPQSSTESSDEN
ncbi:Integral membrane protein DGCR2/IDD [Eufriesea mexicana]|uniref:mucin-12-like isoform X2 n=1 Tax=Eufriesea mexicana TaxID=516756 RepID=UPI00083C5281|nr:PREDICTED: mucin-12-like isoform X2 [Eufriesea mexicana]OAD60338.1 Integral membrane protein DGCR2/IDD [Eufriesea mexicana]